MTGTAPSISIHAPREGSDLEAPAHGPVADDISIHAPREGSDKLASPSKIRPSTFQSTLPVRGATDILSAIAISILISIHAPREGSDDL